MVPLTAEKTGKCRESWLTRVEILGKPVAGPSCPLSQKKLQTALTAKKHNLRRQKALLTVMAATLELSKQKCGKDLIPMLRAVMDKVDSIQ